MNAAAQLPELSSADVQPADRLGFTLLLAAVLHAALILGLGFTLAEPSQISKTLEITLSTFKSEEKPKEADFLAQDNQQRAEARFLQAISVVDKLVQVYGEERLVATKLNPTRYDKIVEAMGGHGEHCERPEEIAPALERAFASGKPALINVVMRQDIATGMKGSTYM